MLNASQESRKKTWQDIKPQEGHDEKSGNFPLGTRKITTTDAKAKELRGVADKMITLGKRGTLHARRQALSFIRDNSVTKKVFEELSPRYAERAGGVYAGSEDREQERATMLPFPL